MPPAQSHPPPAAPSHQEQLTPKIQWDQRGKEGKDGSRAGIPPCPRQPLARREFQQQENAPFHPGNAMGISPDQHRPPAPPPWKLRALNVFLKLHRPCSQLELFLGTERPDKFRAISVPHWGWRGWGWLCRCAQMCPAEAAPGGKGTGGFSLGVTHPPTPPRDSACRVVTPSRVLPCL